MDQLQSDGVLVESIDPVTLSQWEPALAVPEDLRCIYWLAEEAQVRPARLLKALRTILRRRGVEADDEVQILGWARLGPDRVALQTNRGRWTASWICITAGPWSAPLLRRLRTELPVEPRRGQMVAWQTPCPLLQRIVNEGPRYLVPREDGWLLVGSTVEEVGFDVSTTAEGTEELARFAREWIPALRAIRPRDAWAGLRPYSRDGRPHLGRLPPWNNVLVATGHFRSGIHLAPATAQCLTELILGRSPPIDLSPFAPRLG
jgi:glycine oxidase